MKITDVKAYTLQAKLPEYFGASQTWGNNRNATLIEISTDEGISGYGEAGAGRETTAGQALVESFRPMIVGEDPFDIEKITQNIGRTLGSGLNRGMPVRAISGIDMALWDIVGKALKVPIYKLWGGAVRTKIPVYATGLYYTEAKDQARARTEEAATYLRLGFKAMKMKIGGLSLKDDLKQIEAVRKTIGPDIPLMVDANQAYNAYTAIQMGRGMAQYNVFWFEEPVPYDDLQSYLEVKAALNPLGIAIAGGECLYTRFAFRDFVAKRGFDIAQPDICNTGGPSEVRKIATLCHTFGIHTFPHVWGGPFAVASSLHLMATLPLNPPARNPLPFFQAPGMEFDRTPNPIREQLAAGPAFDQHDGVIDLPQGPGWGVEVNWDTVKRYQVG
ncbi:MAG: mandelate racemase/muconate lactonizing enzyme family protein [Bacteroidetes bacterium]|nr:mandelate racemase/muconate lactonizing enzyme family protein [Bacteroidota bacterium]MCL5025973.1 mandelate racemase/muconate lactonizing enzyme family protein [Chloroflexota bacterium]